MDYLGHDRESIGREKAGIMRTGKPAIVSDPMPPQSVLDQAAEIGADLWLLRARLQLLGRQAAMGLGRPRPALQRAWPIRRCAAPTSCSTHRACWPRSRRCATALPITAQAVRNGLAMVELPGRFQIVPGQPTLVLDVAHNPHSVAALAQNLDAMGFYPATHAVFGAMARQGPRAPCSRGSAPLVDRWYFTDLPTAARRHGRRPCWPGGRRRKRAAT